MLALVGQGTTLLPWLDTVLSQLLQEIDVDKLGSRLNITDWGDLTVDQLTSLTSHLTCGSTLANLTNSEEPQPLDPPSPGLTSLETKNSSAPLIPLPRGCSLLYYSLIQWQPWTGQLVWGVLQGLLRGQVLYTPDNPVVREVIKKANKTFEVFDQFREKSQTLGNVYTDLKHLDEYEGAAAIITTLFSSNFYNELSESALKDKYGLDMRALEGTNVSRMVAEINERLPVIQVFNLLTNSLSCLETDRFVPHKTEGDIIAAASTGETKFLAGLVFKDPTEANWTGGELPENVHYLIRYLFLPGGTWYLMLPDGGTLWYLMFTT